MKLDLNNRKFRTQSNSINGEVSEDTIFHYRQIGDIITADYEGGHIVKGNLIGKIVDNRFLDFVYHHVNIKGEIMTGICQSFPEISSSGKIILKEYWQWTCGDHSNGESILMEI